ncbi:MAG TPA: HAMP domain-containing sensor histidine kinase [Polyangiaceae bacterium]|jgi:signal transduction histidine kinase|nr:HAMP domain-containing sensor histidine kinase [Polyangiaceae bacterium]
MQLVRSDITLRLARWSLYGVIAVVLMFGATLVYTQAVLEPIQAQTEALTDNALPSVKQLSTARDALVRLERELQTYVIAEQDAAAQAVTKGKIENARRDLDVALDAYGDLPQFPGEHQLSVKVDDAVALLDEHLGETLAHPKEPSPAARAAKVEYLSPFVESANVALFRVQVFNIDQAAEQAQKISSLKKRSRAISLGLSGGSLLGALFAAWLVLRSARRQAKLAADHEALLVTRATELEAFAGRVAHDLKNPLGALALRLALMKQERCADLAKQQAHVDKAVLQIARIDRLIEGLLAFARAGASPPPGAHAPLHEVMEEVVEELRPAAQLAHAELRVEPFSPREVACTPGALLSVLSNLVGNAVKYIGEGGPEREIVVHVDDRDDGVCVEIADTGPGIPADAEGRVFLPFVRLGSVQPGIGLGLATVKRIVEAFGGRVGVRSVFGEGSVFWFELPKAESAA